MKKLIKNSSKNATITSYCNCESVPCASSTYCRSWCIDGSPWTSVATETQDSYDNQVTNKYSASYK